MNTSPPYHIEVKKCSLIFEIPKYFFLEDVKVGTLCDETLSIQIDEETEFCLKCFPNGDHESNQGYVSMKCAFEFSYSFFAIFLCSLYATFALIDDEGNLRFPQSFVMDYYNKHARNKFIGFSRFIKRKMLLSSDIFCKENLIVQCDVLYYTAKISEDFLNNLKHPTIEVCDKQTKLTMEVAPIFKFLYECGAIKITNVYIGDYRPFRETNYAISLDFINLDDAFTVYEFADYHLFPELKQKCCDHIKTHMELGYLLEALDIMQLYSDNDLKSFLFKYIRKHWNNPTVLGVFQGLRLCHPYLAQEIVAFKESKEETSKKMTAKEVDVAPSGKLENDLTGKLWNRNRIIIEIKPDFQEYFEFYHL